MAARDIYIVLGVLPLTTYGQVMNILTLHWN
jgi:hypothetical protein